MAQENIHYATPEIERFYRSHRTRWADFYDSERTVLDWLRIGPETRVLDIGCGCGGLGLALRERYGVRRYTGVEVNRQAADTAAALNPAARILHGDILDLASGELRETPFELVVSFSCVDWNVRFTDMLQVAYDLTTPGGHFVSSYRLTNLATVNDIKRSYQFINYEGKRKGERANYVVVNAAELRQQLIGLHPSALLGYGYWGNPGATAVTPYDRICFSVIAVQRPSHGLSGAPESRLELPAEILGLAAGSP